jgi:hypothetical protein
LRLAEQTFALQARPSGSAGFIVPFRLPRPARGPAADPRDDVPAVPRPEMGGTAGGARPAGEGQSAGSRPEITLADQMAHIGAVFSGEPYDPAWARDTERTIRSGLAALTDSRSVASVECRQALCKAEVEYEDEAGYLSFAKRMFEPPEFWTGAKAVLKGDAVPGQKARAIAYFSRDDHPMPILR